LSGTFRESSIIDVDGLFKVLSCVYSLLTNFQLLQLWYQYGKAECDVQSPVASSGFMTTQEQMAT
jgi:hypothetical protein